MNLKFLGKYVALFILAVFSITVFTYASIDKTNEWIEIKCDSCLYDNNNHAAFTSLVEFNGNKYVAFREANHHRSTSTDKGIIRIFVNSGNGWKPEYSFRKEGVDLRDPYFLKWGERLLLYTSGFFSEKTPKGWRHLEQIHHDASHKSHIWKMRVKDNVAYGIGNAQGEWPLLFNSTNGKDWHVINEFKLGGNATEADMVFSGDSMFVCIRIDTPIGSNSLWGKSIYPFTSFEWSVMDISIGSPEMIALSDNHILLACREYDFHRKDGKNNRYVSLFVLDKNGKVKKRYVVESRDGDQGYPGLYRERDNTFCMSYYSGWDKTKIKFLKFIVNLSKLN